MWFLQRKTTLEESGIFDRFIDWHCHILPGVDDGVGRMDQSLAILSRYEQLGVSEVWLTPHVMEDMSNTTASLRQCFAAFTAAYRGPVKLHLSAENMLDSVFRERFLSDDLLTWGVYGDRLLVETSCYKAPASFRNLLQGIKSRGLFPTLAHPERYHYMTPSDCVELRKDGVEMQLNLFSLFGLYGKLVKRKAEFLLEEGLYDYVATDLHAYEVLESILQKSLRKKTVERLLRICRK